MDVHPSSMGRWWRMLQGMCLQKHEDICQAGRSCSIEYEWGLKNRNCSLISGEHYLRSAMVYFFCVSAACVKMEFKIVCIVFTVSATATINANKCIGLISNLGYICC